MALISAKTRVICCQTAGDKKIFMWESCWPVRICYHLLYIPKKEELPHVGIVYKSWPGKYLTIKYILCMYNLSEQLGIEKKEKKLLCGVFSGLKQVKKKPQFNFSGLLGTYLPIFIIYYFLMYPQA